VNIAVAEIVCEAGRWDIRTPEPRERWEGCCRRLGLRLLLGDQIITVPCLEFVMEMEVVHQYRPD